MMPLILYKCRAWVIFVDIFIPELGLDIVYIIVFDLSARL